MNFEFNIFGKNGKKDLYYKSDKKKLLQQIAENSQEQSQVTVHRDGYNFDYIYYVYIIRLSDRNSFFGICLSFNRIYCTDNKKIFDLFEEAIKTEIVSPKKILESDSTGNIVFATDDFTKNEVDISDLNNFFRDKIEADFQNDLKPIDSSFEQRTNKPQYVSFQDKPEYIIKTIKKYNYVTITQNARERSHNRTGFENMIIKFKQKHKWVNWIFGFTFLIILGLLIVLLVKEKCTLSMVFLLEIPLVASLYFWLFEKFTKGKNELLLAIFSFVVSILGLALTIDNNVFSQSDGNYGNIIKRCFQKDNTVDISEKLNEWDATPHLVFVLDMSGSIKSKEYGNGTENEELFKDVCKLMRTDTLKIEAVLRNFLDNKKFTEYTEYDIYKLKILKIIAEKQELYQNKIDIVCFAGDVEHKKNVDCNKIIKIVKNLESNIDLIENNKTNFIRLIEKLSKLYDETPKKDHSNAPKYTFLFFSDYQHDNGEKLTNKKITEIEDELTDLIYNFYYKQNFSNYFFTNSLIQTPKENEFPVLPLFEELIDESSKAHLVKMEDDEYDFMDILPKEVIPIYYEHSYPDSNLKTRLTFNHIGASEKVKISLKKNPHNILDCHHLFTVREKDTVLVSPASDIELSKDNPLTLTFSGRIIDSYSSTLLTFQSKNHGYARFDIVFFKDLPWFCRYIIAITIFFSWLFVFSVFFCFKK